MQFLFFSEFVALIPEFFFGFLICFYLGIFSVLNSVKFTSFCKSFIKYHICFYLSLYFIFFIFVLVLNNSSDFCLCFFGFISYDFITFFSRLLILFISFSVLAISFTFNRRLILSFEFFSIFLMSIFSIFLLVSSTDFVSVYLCLEFQALSFYLLSASNKHSSFSIESSLKYFVIGAFSSGFFIFGSSIIYGFFGTTNYFFLKDLFLFFDGFHTYFIFIGIFFVFISFLFKLGVVPYHIWIVDIYEGVNPTITFYFIILPKLALFVCFFRFLFIHYFSFYQLIFIFSSFLCFFVGSVGALFQKRFKRFIIYSSFCHLGFIVLSLSSNSLLSVQASLFYLMFYLFIILGFFIFFLNILSRGPKHLVFLDELEGLKSENYVLSVFLMFLFFSIAGVPPFSGFFIKLFVFYSVLDVTSFFVFGFIVFFSILICYYYLNLVKLVCFSSQFSNSSYFCSVYYYSLFSKFHSIFIGFSLFVTIIFPFFSRLFFNLCFLFSLNFFYLLFL